MRYVTSGVLAVALELLIVAGVVGMIGASPKNIVTYPEMISINLTSAPAISMTSSLINAARKGENGKGKKISPKLSETDTKIINTLKNITVMTSKKNAGSPKGSNVPLYEQKVTPSMPASSAEFVSPSEVNPSIPKSINPQFAQVNASTTLAYTFSQLIDLGIPNFQVVQGSMKRDYELELSKLPTAMAYTLSGVVKGIAEVQKDGSVRVQKIISSPSVILTDIYVRNIEKLVSFPRSFALQNIEIDAIFNPSSGEIK